MVYLFGISNGAVATVVLLGLLVWSLTGAVPAIMAMSFVAIMKFSNSAVASFSPLSTVLFWAITMAASARLYVSARRVSAPFVWLLLFAVVAAALSAAVSKNVDISLMKVLSFFIASSALVISADSLKEEDIHRLQRWFFSVALVMAALAVLTLPFPGIAFRRVAGSLQGMFSHPQTTGVFFVPFASWLIARIFLERLVIIPRWVFGMAIFFSAMIVASGARTAMLATFVSVAVTLMIVLLQGRTDGGNRSRGQIVGFALLMLILSTGILASGVLQDEVESIIYKGDEPSSLDDAFQSSRGAGIEQHIQNFKDAPFTGHGFGVYREGVRENRVVRFMGIPLSASAEKGVVFTSVLEEVGIFGAVLFYALLLSIIARAARGDAPGVLAMSIGTIAVNFGEAIIFATGGMGLFMWLVLSFGLARSRPRADTPSSERAAVLESKDWRGGRDQPVCDGRRGSRSPAETVYRAGEPAVAASHAATSAAEVMRPVVNAE